MRRSLLFGIIAASALALLIVVEVRTQYAQDLVEEFVFGADIPCAKWPTLAEWEEVNREMALAEDYLGGSIYTTLVFDEDAARAAGISDETLALNDEMTSFINAGIEDLEAGGEMMDMDEEEAEAERLLEEEYPKFKAFYDCGRYRQNPYRAR